MKSILQIGFLFIATFSFGQRNEFSLYYSTGIPNRNFEQSLPTYMGRLNYKNAKIFKESSINLHYSFDIINKPKYQLKLLTGVSYSSSSYSQNIIDMKYGYALDNAVFINRQLSIPLIVGIEKNFYYNKFALEFQLGFNKDFAQKKGQTDSVIVTGKYDFIDYYYNLEARYKNNMSISLSLISKYNLYKNIYFVFSVSYLTNKKVSYNYTVETIYNIVNLNTGANSKEYWWYRSIDNIPLKDNFYYFSAGFCFKIGRNHTSIEYQLYKNRSIQ